MPSASPCPSITCRPGTYWYCARERERPRWVVAYWRPRFSCRHLGYLSPLATAELAPFSVSRACCGGPPRDPISRARSVSGGQGNPNPNPAAATCMRVPRRTTYSNRSACRGSTAAEIPSRSGHGPAGQISIHRRFAFVSFAPPQRRDRDPGPGQRHGGVCGVEGPRRGVGGDSSLAVAVQQRDFRESFLVVPRPRWGPGLYV